MKDSINSKRGRFILIFLAIVLIGGIWFMFLRTSGEPTDGLDGKWLRTDGDYTIEISDVAEDGEMTAKYFNPTPALYLFAIFLLNFNKESFAMVKG